MRYFIIAGEPSGDNYATQLIKGLQEADPNAVISYFGPDASSAVMGFVEVLSKAGVLLKRLASCKKQLLAFNADVLILIDYPTFNMQMAGFAHKHHIKTFYYIAPKVWASREWRVRKMRRVIDRLYVIFPFETDYFTAKGIDAVYLGNPLMDTLHETIYSEETDTQFNQDFMLSDKPILAILPGSRLAEINFTLPRAAAIIKDFPDHQWIVAAAHGIPIEVYDRYLKDLPARVIYGSTHKILQHAQAAIVTSGTATLEAALLHCPQVVCYGGNPLSVAIARKIIKINHIALPDIILDKNTVHELVQKDCTPEHLKDELLHLLPGRQRRRSVLADYKHLHKLLGTQGAINRAAHDMVETLTGIPEKPIYKAYLSTQFGMFCFTANDSQELIAASFVDETQEGYFCHKKPLDDMQDVPQVLQDAVRQIKEYFAGTRRSFDLPLYIDGTDFQKTVWEQLLTIPYGTTCSYLELAQKCGNPKAARAVGQANNANPFAIIIPCHRVIGNDGSLVGYAGGLTVKQKILAMEKTYAPESTNSLF